MYQGILGGFSGTVGTVVGSTNKKGDDIIRAKSKNKRVSNTEAQVNHRQKFGMVTSFLQHFNPILQIGFKEKAENLMSPYNYACQQALKEGIIGDSPDVSLDYSKIKLSSGGLGMSAGTNAELVGTKVIFSWSNNETMTTQLLNKVILVVFNVENYEVSSSTTGFTRANETAEIAIPYSEIGDHLLCYLFFQSDQNPLKVSNSQLVAELVVIPNP